MKKTENEWIVTRVDGRIASVSMTYGHLARIAGTIARQSPSLVASVSTEKISTSDLTALAKTTAWEDLCLFGSSFQKKVWEKLFSLNHSEGKYAPSRKLYSYSDFAALCDNPAGVRAVAHAVACNPVAFIIPCHLIVPKESIDKIAEIRESAQSTLFEGRDLYLLDAVDFGEYEHGKAIKRNLIALEFGL